MRYLREMFLAIVALMAAFPGAAQDERFLPGPQVEFHGRLGLNLVDPDRTRPRIAALGRAIERELDARGLGDMRVVMHYLPLIAEEPISLYRHTAGLPPPMVGPRYAIDPMPGVPAPEGRTIHIALSAAQVLSDYAYRESSSPPIRQTVEPGCIYAIAEDHGDNHLRDDFPYEHDYYPCLDPRLEDQLRRIMWSHGPWLLEGRYELEILNHLNRCLLPDPDAYAAFLADDVAGLFDGTRQERPPGKPLAAFAPKIECEEESDVRERYGVGWE